MDNNPTTSQAFPSQENIKIEVVGFPIQYKVWANLVTFTMNKSVYH